MGHPVIIEELMNVLNGRQGQTITREQLVRLTGLSPQQVSTGMRSLVGRTNGRIEVVLRARSWRMLPDGTTPKVVTLAAPKSAPTPAPEVVKAELAVDALANLPKVTLTLLGKTTDGSEIGRDKNGQLYGVRKL